MSTSKIVLLIGAGLAVVWIVRKKLDAPAWGTSLVKKKTAKRKKAPKRFRRKVAGE